MNAPQPGAPQKPRGRLRRWLDRSLTARGRQLEITRSGWIFIGLTLAVGFAAINSGANLLHALFGALMALIIGSGVLSEANLRRIRVQRTRQGPLYAGEAGLCEVRLTNTDPRRDVLAVSVEDDARKMSDAGCDPVFAVRVAAGQTVQLSARVLMPARGHHALPRAVVATRFPFGLFIKRRELPLEAPVRVYPRRIRTTLAPLPHTRGGPPRATGRRARAGEFHGLRSYREGDELRRLHWPATARLGKLVVREYEAGGEARVRLSLAPGTAGEVGFESEIEQVAAQARLRLLRDGAEVELYYGDRCAVPAGYGRAQDERLLDFLSEVG